MTEEAPSNRLPVPGALALAAFIYPLVAAGVLLLFSPVILAMGVMISEGVLLLLMAGAYAIGAGLVLAPITLLAAFPLWLGARALRQLYRDSPPSDAELAAHVGALVALLGTSAVLLLVVWQGAPSAVLLVVLPLGPGLATPIAQYAGARSQWTAGAWTDERARWRFNLRQLLVVTTVAAVVLTLLRLMGILSPRVLLYLLGWLVYQRVTLSMVRRICEAQCSRAGGMGGVLEGGGGYGEGMSE